MSDPQKLALQHVKFHEDLKTVSYFFDLDGDERVISYGFHEDDAVRIGVRKTPRDTPLVELRAGRDSIRARTPEGEFVLERGKRVLPPTTDEPALWLVAQNWINNTTTAPDRLLEIAGTMLPAGSEVEVSGIKININWDDFWDFFSEDGCLSPGQTTSCTETDTAGNSHQIEFKCDCGTPFCTTQSFSSEVPVLVTDSSTGEVRHDNMTVTYTVCICWCMDFSM